MPEPYPLFLNLEGRLCVVVGGGRVLIGGQSEHATGKAVCRFLEELGCRYFMDSALGEVFPRTQDLSAKPGTIH